MSIHGVLLDAQQNASETEDETLIAKQKRSIATVTANPLTVKVTFDDLNIKQAHKHYNHSAQSAYN